MQMQMQMQMRGGGGGGKKEYSRNARETFTMLSSMQIG